MKKYLIKVQGEWTGPEFSHWDVDIETDTWEEALECLKEVPKTVIYEVYKDDEYVGEFFVT